MAGMEQLEVHSKSYLVRWVNVSAGHTVSWSIQPHKKSINFGIFKHPGTATGTTPYLPSSATFEAPSTPALEVPGGRGRGSSNPASRNDRTFVFEKLSAIGLKQVHWAGKCDADKVSVGTYDVPEGEGGMYGLVFDNTFSKTVSKTATFVLMTYPTNSPPKSGHHMHYAQAIAGASSTSLSRSSPGLGPISDSTESLPSDPLGGGRKFAERPKSSYTMATSAPANSSFLTGVLQKKRRKRNQGYARRFFSLDYTSSTLSYYRNDHSSALRGAIPLSLAAIGANDKTREISVDSGAEVWHLRANNKKDFDMWRQALDRASRTAAGLSSPTLVIQDRPWDTAPHIVSEAEEREWAMVESLVGRVAGTRDAVRRLAQDTDPKYHKPGGLGITKAHENHSPSPSETDSGDYFPDQEKADRKAFWKRKASSSGSSPSGLFRRSVSAQMAVASPTTIPPVPPLPNGNLAVPKRTSPQSTLYQPQEEGVHDHCMALLRDLDGVVEEFSALISESRQRRAPAPLSARAASPRRSIDSQSSEEFFDATDGETVKSQLLTIRRDSDDDEHERDDVSDGESESSSEAGGTSVFNRVPTEGQPSLFPMKPKSLSPLPLERVKRRTNVPPAKGQPPSLIGFLRKNVGKDLSTIAMPVTANEPTSLLQRLAEQMEYSELLDAAVTANPDSGDRLVHIAAFAISAFSNARVKDRAIRKPFNPMLGETFELVREDKNFRFLAEKVVHRPVRMACQAESPHWTFLQSPTPVQKFWGKSAELNTDGRARVFLHASAEHYSWIIATSFLRNVIAGEKYVEPVGTMTIMHENSGAKAVCTFKAGGMFAGRSEDVTIQCFSPTGNLLPAGGQGKWTTELQGTMNGQPTGKSIWQVGNLVEKPTQHYGFTSFAAELNQITPIEHGKLPPTDSRVRPDQRAAEEGDFDRAEAVKARLEERQRARRRVMEEHGEEWTPRWFVKAEGTALSGEQEMEEEVWRLRGGKEGYWEERERGVWEGVLDVFQT
ncbi:Oxysterol-binding protein-domain-containing protein [Clohesyomyces aquaticus]|uniref:Oxysterol-binding protein-domain-containing protein n=1 Tax=Clohesyomyces aquaticus TaxID=1231657 RepID=A0A1Y1YHB2_9PLEO|nr:Oxysterol-binding protein-domain-containing protein [Clohesyomyces aquaticus]